MVFVFIKIISGSVVVDFLFVATPIVGVCNWSMFCCTLLYVHPSIAIILMEKRELVALLNLSSWCLVMVEWLFLAVPWGCLRFVIVVFLIIHTYYFLFLVMCSLQQMLEIIALVLKSNVQAKYTKNVFKGSLHKLILYI